MKNVLVFPCGSEIGLEINRALGKTKHFKLFGASSVDDHGKFAYQNYIAGLPHIDSPEFINKINEKIKLYKIDFLIPAHDSVVLKLVENQDILNATVITSIAETCRICRSKKMTYELFETFLPIPQIYSALEQMKFPIFLKPDVGQGSKGTYIAWNRDDLDFYLRKDPSLLLLEYLPGKEYTIDCFTNKTGKLLFSEGRERARISNGISVSSKPVENDRFREIAELINRNLSFQGAWFYQVKERANGELVLLEIAPRIAGTAALFRVCGVNLIELSLFDRMGHDITIVYNNLDVEIDRALSNKYRFMYEYDCVYIDFDDTVIVNNVINTDIMKYLYQLRNNDKKIILLSKHKENIKKTLKNYAISEFLFEKIIILKENQEKTDFILEKNAIFIDDSFSERRKVFERIGIPVFSLDALEILLS